MQRAVDAGIERLLVPGWDLSSSLAALELAERRSPLVVAAVGVHPHYAAATDERAWQELEVLVADPRCSAVGEIGLDFFRNLSPPDVQRASMDRQLGLAARRGLPVVVHDRDAHDEVTAMLLAWGGRPQHSARGVLHAFSGDPAMAATLIARGFLISFAFPIAFRSAVGPRAAAPLVPGGSYLVETDAPYLGPDRDGRNEPATVLRVAAELAVLRQVDPTVVVSEARGAFERLVGV